MFYEMFAKNSCYRIIPERQPLGYIPLKVGSGIYVYVDKPRMLPPFYQDRIKSEDKYRVICDYIAGMTDRYALEEYKKFFEPYERV